ncbi:hypothetical protein EDB89DRAFT_1917079 [Lactarius sanguifluus]|nr:hypothetical protein EDB89DRAFT_1917079 [Lactarius sanguifluus]
MSNPSKSFLHSDDQQAGQVQKVKKVIQVQYYSSESQGAASVGSDVAGRWWWGRGCDVARGALCRILYGAGRRGGGVAVAWRWRGVAWRGSRSWVGWVSLASRRVGGREVLHAVLLGHDMVAMSKRRKRKRKKDLTSCTGGVGGNVGQSKRKGLVGSELVWWWAPRIVLRVSSWRILYVAKAWRRGRILVKVDGDGGHEFMCGEVARQL